MRGNCEKMYIPVFWAADEDFLVEVELLMEVVLV